MKRQVNQLQDGCTYDIMAGITCHSQPASASVRAYAELCNYVMFGAP